MKNITLRLRLVTTAGIGLVLAAGVALPTVASAATLDSGAEGGAALMHEGDTRVVIDGTTHGGIAPLTTARVGGGFWIYGLGGGFSYSYHDHSSTTHKSTACSRTNCSYSGWVSKNTRSVAKTLKTGSGNTAYWNTK